MDKKVLKVYHHRKYGYEIRTELVDGAEFGGEDFEMRSCYTDNGDYIGDTKVAILLCKKRGIRPEKVDPDDNVCSIGWSEQEQKWFGWSHRAICGFAIGDIAKEGDCVTQSGYIEEYAKAHPELDRTVPVGFRAKSLPDCKRMAVAFADSVG